MAEEFGTPQRDWILVEETDTDGTLSAHGAYSLLGWSGTPLLPSTLPTTVGWAVIPLLPGETEPAGPNALVISPFGEGEDEAQGQMRIWGVSKTPIDIGAGVYAYKAVYLGTLHLSLGLTQADFIEDGYAFVDRIAVAEDGSPTPPGIKVYGDVKNAMAEVSIDTYGCQFIVIKYTVQQFNTQGGSPPPEMDELGLFYRTI